MHNDDTTVKILELMGKRARQEALAEDVSEDSAKKKPAERSGMFTTGIVSTRGGCKIALFLSGRQHAGENLKDVLVRRAANRLKRRSRCATRSHGICLPGWRRFLPTVWLMAGDSLSMWQTGFPRSASRCWSRSL